MKKKSSIYEIINKGLTSIISFYYLLQYTRTHACHKSLFESIKIHKTIIQKKKSFFLKKIVQGNINKHMIIYLYNIIVYTIWVTIKT